MGLLTKLFGSAGEGAGTVVKDTLGGVGQLAKDIREAITGDMSADKKAELAAKAMDLEQKAKDGQVAINIEEAKSGSLWKGGWRPYIGWICGTAIGTYYIPQYLVAVAVWVMGCWAARAIQPFPIDEPERLMELVVALLGLGTLRTVERLAGKTK